MKHKVPVLMYHDIIKEDNDYGVNIKLFYKQMLLMKKMGYESINLNQIESVSSNKKFVITFDDGYENVYAYAMPILKKLNFTATCFFVSNFINKSNDWDKTFKYYVKKKIMTYGQIKSWAQNNFEIGSHSFDHKNLNTLNDNEIIKQLNESKLFIKKNFGRNVESFSYPYGKYNKEISLLVKKYYKFAVTTKRSRFDKSKFSLLEIPRIPINPDTGVLKFYLKVKTYYEDLKFRK